MHLLVVGGGSAGHVIPALPVIAAMQGHGARVSYIGTHSGLERELVKDLDVTFHAISAGKLRRYFSWQNFTDMFRRIDAAGFSYTDITNDEILAQFVI